MDKMKEFEYRNTQISKFRQELDNANKIKIGEAVSWTPHVSPHALSKDRIDEATREQVQSSWQVSTENENQKRDQFRLNSPFDSRSCLAPLKWDEAQLPIRGIQEVSINKTEENVSGRSQ